MNDRRVKMTLWSNPILKGNNLLVFQEMAKTRIEDYFNSNFPTLFDGVPIMCVGIGWFSNLIELFEKIKNTKNSCIVSDFKVKYGSLRVYTHPSSDEIATFVDHAELSSRETCEICGMRGSFQEKRFNVRCAHHIELGC